MTLAKQREEILLPEDKEEVAALEILKEQMRLKYPSGDIPKSEMEKFARERKIYRFKQFLKNKLFKIIFRDAEFMKALDKSNAEKA